MAHKIMFKNLLREGDLGRVVYCKGLFVPLCLLCKDAVAEELGQKEKRQKVKELKGSLRSQQNLTEVTAQTFGSSKIPFLLKSSEPSEPWVRRVFGFLQMQP